MDARVTLLLFSFLPPLKPGIDQAETPEWLSFSGVTWPG